MRLQPLYRATFTTPERWAVEVAGAHGTEVQDFLIAEGRTEDVSARLRGSTIPAGAQTAHCSPTFAAPLTPMTAPRSFSWQGYARPGAPDREIVGSITHVTGNERYAWLNNTVCAMVGECGPERAERISRSSSTSPSSSGSHWTSRVPPPSDECTAALVPAVITSPQGHVQASAWTRSVMPSSSRMRELQPSTQAAFEESAVMWRTSPSRYWPVVTGGGPPMAADIGSAIRPTVWISAVPMFMAVDPPSGRSAIVAATTASATSSTWTKFRRC